MTGSALQSGGASAAPTILEQGLVVGSTDLIRDLQGRLDLHASPKTKAWWEAYLKNAIPFRGVKMGDVRRALHAWYADRSIGSALSLGDQKDLALALFREDYAEDKLAGTLFLQEILLPAGGIDWEEDLLRFADLFDQGWINDWNLCDWFCVKVLGPLVAQEGKACAREIAGWSHADKLWQRRASVVAFVNLAKEGEANFVGFTGLVLGACAQTVKSPERFSQTGTGWVLRELSLAEPARVTAFAEDYLCALSSEGLRYATEKLPESTRGELKRARRRC